MRGRSTRPLYDGAATSVRRLAGIPGLEPRTKEPETFVLPITPYPITVPFLAFRLITGTSNNYTGLSGGVQAEIWRAASHSRFYARYFRVFPGFLGLKSFLNFFKKRVLEPIFPLHSSSEVARRVVLPPLLCTLCVPNFLKIFPALPPDSQMTGQSGRQVTKAAWRPTRPSNHLGKDHRTRCPRLQKLKTQRQQNPETTKKPRG